MEQTLQRLIPCRIYYFITNDLLFTDAVHATNRSLFLPD